MRQLIVLFAAALLLTGCKSTMPREKQTAEKFKKRVAHELSANYLLYLPTDYDARVRKRWPLMLFLHGAGERGTNLSLVAVHGPPKLIKQKRDFPFIIVSPQCPAGEHWSNETLAALLDHVTRKYNVDTNRIY